MHQLSRRDFANRAVVAASGLAAVTAVQGAEAPRRRSRIRIGVRFNEAWLNSKNDEDLKFFKQIGVDHVDIELILLKGYKESVNSSSSTEFTERARSKAWCSQSAARLALPR